MSGEYGGCGRISQPSSARFRRVSCSNMRPSIIMKQYDMITVERGRPFF